MTAPTYLPSDNPRVTPADHPFRFCLPVQIRFSDIDMLGHLNNNVYLTFMDLAKIEYFCAVNGAPVSVHDLCMVVVNVNCDFVSPTFLGDSIEVWTRTTHIGERSVRLEQRLVDRNTGETKCVVRTVMAGFDPKTMTGIPIPERWVGKIETFEQRTFVD